MTDEHIRSLETVRREEPNEKAAPPFGVERVADDDEHGWCRGCGAGFRYAWQRCPNTRCGVCLSCCVCEPSEIA